MKEKEQIPQALPKHVSPSSSSVSLNNYCEKQLPTHETRLFSTSRAAIIKSEGWWNKSTDRVLNFTGFLGIDVKRKALQNFSSLPIFSPSSIVMKTHTHTRYVCKTNYKFGNICCKGKKNPHNSELTQDVCIYYRKLKGSEDGRSLVVQYAQN